MVVLAGIGLLGTATVAAQTAPKGAAPAPAAPPPVSAPAATREPGAAAHPTSAAVHPTGAAPTAPAPTASAPAPAAKIDWEKMKIGERKKYMKSTVLPEMKKVFAAFDPKTYGKVTCETCHGKGAVEKKYKMPNPDLPKLPGPTDRAAFMALAQKKPDAVKFMGTQVKPKMAALLGEAEWSPANPKGFACYECHTHEEGPAAGAKEAPTGEAPKAAPAPAKVGPTTPTTAPAAPAKTAAPAHPAETKGW
jgi:hypothetical protein